MKSTVKIYIPLTKNIELFFNFDNCIIETTRDCDKVKIESEYGCLIISILIEHKSFESSDRLGALSRPRYLNILDIISFLIDEPLDVFNSSYEILKNKEQDLLFNQVEKFIYESINKSEFLTNFIGRLSKLQKEEKSLIFSILDRWRKARYLEKESEGNFLYDDESTLYYFHILELLANFYSRQLENSANELIAEFSKNYNLNILSLTDTTLDSKNSETIKILKKILNKDISIYSKIIYLLKELNLYSMETDLWIKSLIDSRNSVAHGRRVYYDKAIYPLKPFYPLITNELYSLEFLRIFIGKVISSHLKIVLFNNEWNQIKDLLIADKLTTKRFIKDNQIKIKDLSMEKQKIVFGGLNYFIISKKIKIEESEKFYKFYLETEIDNQDFLATNITAIVLLYESNIDNIDNMLKMAIINTHKYDCNPYYDFKNMLYYLDYLGFKTPKLESLILKNEVR